MLSVFLALLAATGCVSALPALDRRQESGNRTCDARKYAQLIGGIQENMFIQKQELTGLQTLQALSTSSSPVNATHSDFQLNQLALQTTQQTAIAVRERNQRLADDLNSPSAMGLALVAQSQVAVMLDTQGLRGTGGGGGDEEMLGKLVERVKGTMVQNEENLMMAERGCGSWS